MKAVSNALLSYTFGSIKNCQDGYVQWVILSVIQGSGISCLNSEHFDYHRSGSIPDIPDFSSPWWRTGKETESKLVAKWIILKTAPKYMTVQAGRPKWLTESVNNRLTNKDIRGSILFISESLCALNSNEFNKHWKVEICLWQQRIDRATRFGSRGKMFVRVWSGLRVQWPSESEHWSWSWREIGQSEASTGVLQPMRGGGFLWALVLASVSWCRAGMAESERGPLWGHGDVLGPLLALSLSLSLSSGLHVTSIMTKCHSVIMMIII